MQLTTSQAALDATGRTVRRAAVLGSPVAHSLSPLLHAAAYDALGLTGWSYERIECTEDQLPPLVEGIGPEWAGFSLTMPLKRVTLHVADRLSDRVRAIGAANTLVFGAHGSLAENTDVDGIVRSVREVGSDRIGHAVVLGAGGTAQAALAALRELGASGITVLVRDLGRSRALRETADRLDVGIRVVRGLPEADIPAADIVISTLPPGAADPFTDQRWDGIPLLFDVVYAPWPTRFAAAAQAAGVQVLGGHLMLLHQAAAQVELMTGRPAPVEAMRAALGLMPSAQR